MCPTKLDEISMNAQRMVCDLEEREARRAGLTLANARCVIARRLGASPGTLENIRRDRVKSPRAWLVDRVRALFIAELQSEIRRLEHELDLARQSGAHPAGDEMAEAETLLARAKTLIGEKH